MGELLTSARADSLASEINASGSPLRTLKGTTHEVSAAQFRTAARIIREAERPVANGVSSERPAFIHQEHQDDPELLRLDVGILSGDSFWIDRDGVVVRSTEDVHDGPLTFCAACWLPKNRCDDRRHRRVVEVPADLVAELRKNYTEAGVRQWIVGFNDGLKAHPIELLKASQVQRVHRAAAALTDGAFA